MKKELLLACSLCWGMLLNAERMEPFIMQDLIRSRHRMRSIPLMSILNHGRWTVC